MRTLRFVTTNADKVAEARERLPVPVEQFDYDYVERQSDSLAEIATRGAREAHDAADAPVIVDDSGLFVDALEGFPGPYSAYAENTLGVERVARLALAEDDHGAAFRTVVAYADGDVIETFEGTVEGEIVAPRGEGGFGYDPVFEHEGRTFAERSTAEKNEVSHRGRALDALSDWLDGRA
jgi:XTP/dITP diphosphohydrolase